MFKIQINSLHDDDFQHLPQEYCHTEERQSLVSKWDYRMPDFETLRSSV